MKFRLLLRLPLLVVLLRPEGARAAESALSPEELSAIWSHLALADDAGVKKAYQGICTMVKAPKESVAFLRECLKPVPPLNVKRVERWLDELDSNDFATREEATRQLEKQGPLVIPLIKKRLEAEVPSLEMRRRLERLREKLDAKCLSADELRAIRCVEVLHAIGNAEAIELLKALAAGAPGARLTEDAKFTLGLLTRRTPMR